MLVEGEEKRATTAVPSGLTDSVVQGQGVILAAASQDDGLGLAAARQLPLGLA